MGLLRLLIVDDEPLVRVGIRRGLSLIRDIEVLSECSSGSEAVAAIHTLCPDLVLLDVQMSDMTGLDVIAQVGPLRMPSVIFITAYDEYAVKAFELNAVDYLLKPFDDIRLLHSIERARERIASGSQKMIAENLQALLAGQKSTRPERLIVRDGERFDLVPVDSIEWVEAANNYVQLHCGAKTFLLGESLSSLERRLDPDRFLRIHRGKVVNLTRVISLRSGFSSTYELEMRSGKRLTTGRQYRDVVQTHLLK